MPDDVEIRRTKDGRVFVVLHPVCTISKEAILALLAELNVDEKDVVFLLPEDVINCSAIDDMPMVIPIDQASCDAPELEAAGRLYGQTGGRVIVLFGDAFPYQGLHPVADKYGTQCGWSAVLLDACLKRTDVAPPTSSGGTPATRPEPKQVKC